MAHAAAAIPLLRRPQLLSLKPARLLSTLAAPSPGFRRHPRALRPTGPLPSDATEDTDDPDAGDVAFKKSRNELKREARRAVHWGMDLAKFSPQQIKRILSAASLEPEVFDALMLVKVGLPSYFIRSFIALVLDCDIHFVLGLQKFGPEVREGRRRQFNYIGMSASLVLSLQPYISLCCGHIVVLFICVTTDVWDSVNSGFYCGCFCSFKSCQVCNLLVRYGSSWIFQFVGDMDAAHHF